MAGRISKLSSRGMTSHGIRWTLEEDARLLEVMGRTGYGRWTAISRELGNRNSLQVKNRARHLMTFESESEAGRLLWRASRESPRRREKKSAAPIHKEKSSSPVAYSPPTSLRSLSQRRKRRVKDEEGEWIDEELLQGRTICHGEEKHEPKEIRTRKKVNYYEAGDADAHTDPFRLVQLSEYAAGSTPFTVKIEAHVLMAIDFHAHLSLNEVIGLLGGRILEDSRASKFLIIEAVYPCRSVSTGIECEMDPISEMTAVDQCRSRGLEIIGWYHSHPTFEPLPSLRDVETQTAYQSLFHREDLGLEPFVGLIVSPYWRAHTPQSSAYECIYVSDDFDISGSFRLPYRMAVQVAPLSIPWSELYSLLTEILDTQIEDPALVNLADIYDRPTHRAPSRTRLDHMKDSICNLARLKTQHHQGGSYEGEDDSLRQEIIQGLDRLVGDA